uniref:cyclin-dependent kinase n=1 Tax=Timema genevievae TaxID=629358 RepID=A0A7R9PJ70_TIMGE|nr:unnamed protein product [Timema genevievae]
MEKYESISVVGEGSYGLVMKCRHRETGQMVAIKKFIETEEDQVVRKMALREIRMLKVTHIQSWMNNLHPGFINFASYCHSLQSKLRHENLVNMIEVFRRKRRFYLVFEYLDHTVLDELEEHPRGLGEEVSRQHIFQVVRGIDFCHRNNIVHRDVKPENVLVSRLGVIKLCDFGFARLLATPGETYTDYVATRWYRAPELLVGDTKYGREVDIWAIGCLFAEMMSGDPLFPGDSDIDQLFQIIKLLGKLSPRHQTMVARNPMFKGLKKSGGGNEVEEGSARSLFKLFPSWPHVALDLLTLCLKLDPNQRPNSGELMVHSYFTQDRFSERFLSELRTKIQQEFQGNPLLRKYQTTLVVSSAVRKGSSSQMQRRNVLLEPPRWKMSDSGVSDCRRPAGRKTSDPSEGPLPSEDTTQTFSASPTPYQSLESVQQQGISSQQHVLHPSINNLNLNFMGGRLMDALKRSPQPPPAPRPYPRGSMPIHNMLAPPRTQLLRRLGNEPDTRFPSPGSWKAGKTNSGGDDFSLPSLPGVYGSPSKGVKKKLTPMPQHGSNPMDSLMSPVSIPQPTHS